MADTPPPASAGLNYGSGTDRVIARVVDSVIIVALSIAAVTIWEDQPELVSQIGIPAIAAVYEIGFTTQFGGTLGKLAMGLRVVGPDRATWPSPDCSAKRWLPTLAITVIARVAHSGGGAPVGTVLYIAIAVLAVILLSEDDEARSFWDRAGNTRVIQTRVPQRPPRPTQPADLPPPTGPPAGPAEPQPPAQP
ncbi:MAG: RDD family protein [Actinomycetota bacterium]